MFYSEPRPLSIARAKGNTGRLKRRMFSDEVAELEKSELAPSVEVDCIDR